MASLTYGQLVCATCQAELLLKKEEATLLCLACGRSYLIFANRIPVMLPDSISYRVNAYWQYNKHLRETQAALTELRRQATHPLAAARAAHLEEALTTNAAYIAGIQQALVATLSPEYLARPTDKLRPLAYFSSFSYLKRDWCGLAEAEAELQTIVEAVRAGLPAEAGPTAQALVLGAGTARVAAMLKDDFQQVYAIDLSLTMAWQYHDLVDKGAVRFYDIQSKNARTLAEQATEQWATTRLVPNLGPASVQYWVADVKQIPLPTNSVAAVISVYFTDTVPLREYLAEVKRVLRPGGAFIHFGPLEYHFTDISAHLSVEEVRALFETHGFRLTQEREITTSHLFKPSSLASKTYHNWSFSAIMVKKDEATPHATTAQRLPAMAAAIGLQ